MKSIIKLLFTTTIAIMLLSACNNQAAVEAETTGYIYGVAVEKSENVLDYSLVGQTDIAENESNNIIDHVFSKTINGTLPPFYFRILGEMLDYPRVRIDSIIVSNNDGIHIQEIKIGVWLRNATEHNHFGLEFSDFNSSGFLGVSIRRFAGEARHNRTHFYWLWDNELGQFVYDWKLSEVETEDNTIKHTVTQSIGDDMPPLTITLLGRWIEGWSSEIRDMADYVQPNIHVIQVKDNEGKIIQEFDRLNAHPPTWADSFGLHFADYNFNGFLDMALYLGEGGSMRNSPHIYWLWDNQLGKFVHNQELSNLSQLTTIRINEEQQSLWASWRDGGHGHGGIALEYIDGAFVEVSAIVHEFIFMENGEFATRITEFDIIADTEEITYETFFRIRIHENMPEFEFVRRIGRLIDNDIEQSLPEPREISITIYDDMGNIIQHISGLSQSDSHILSGIEFDDLNFDGYLDMRLMRWQDGAGGLLANEYFWLWDNSISQFVLNEQLMEIEYAKLTTCHETSQIVVFNRGDGTFYYRLSHYEYKDGRFVLISDERVLHNDA